jgi:hypothetical protein
MPILDIECVLPAGSAAAPAAAGRQAFGGRLVE